MSLESGPFVVELGDGDGVENTNVVAVDNGADELVVLENVKRNLVDAFDEAATAGGGMLVKAIKVEK